MKQFITKKTKCLNVCRIFLVMAVAVLFGTAYSSSHADAASAYQIRINKQANCVTVYKQNSNGTYKPVKAIICSTGYATKLGTYSLGQKMRWHTLMGPCYGQYCTRIYGGVLFHSVWYTSQNPSTLSISSYNKLGITASHGCVRLTVADAKWIYDNVPSGSKVIIYNSSNPGPLGKPKALKISGHTNWDPSDVWSKGNPWNSKKPSIKGASSKTVKFGSAYKAKSGVKVVTTSGSTASSKLKVSVSYAGEKVGRVDTKRPGTYKVTYTFTDEAKKTARKTVNIKVTAERSTPKITDTKTLYVTSKSKMTKGFAVKNATIRQSGRKLAAKYVRVKYQKLKKNTYKLTYIAQRESYEAKKSVKVYIDNKAPVISGIKNNAEYEASADTVVNQNYCRAIIKKVSDNYTKLKVSDVKISLSETETAGRYKAVYAVSDKAGNTAKYTVYINKKSDVVSGGAIS